MNFSATICILLAILSRSAWQLTYNFHEKFDKVWPFLQMFSKCIIHSIRNPDSNFTPQHNLNILCGDNCIFLQTTKNFENLQVNKFNKSKLDLNFGGTDTLSIYRKFLTAPKFRLVCHVEMYFTVLMSDKMQVIDELEIVVEREFKENEQTDKFYQPDYIFIPAGRKDLISVDKLAIYSTVFTRSVILFFELVQGDISFACIASSVVKQKKELFNEIEGVFHMYVLQSPLTKFADQTETLIKLKLLSDLNSLEQNMHGKSIQCPYELTKSKKSNPLLLFFWSLCLKDIVESKLNCSTEICKELSLYELSFRNQEFVYGNNLYMAFGTEFTRIQYSLLYIPEKRKNIYALLSPLTIDGWLLVLTSGYLVGFMLWILQAPFSPFFWLFTVVLEQNDDKRNKLKTTIVPLILIWLYSSILLRNVFTSNLFTYMALDQEPTDLPVSFDDVLEKPSVHILTSNTAYGFLKRYEFDAERRNFTSKWKWRRFI